MIVAGIGVVINTLTALMFVKGQKNDLNIKGAFLHMAADAAVSLGVVIAGLLIRYTGANWLDPVMSILIALIIIGGTWRLFVDSVNLALDATPEIKLDEVSQTLLAHEDVVEVHDLHIWAMSTSENAMSAHITVEAQSSAKLLGEIRGVLAEKFHLSHTTIQLETKEVQLQCQSC